MNDQSKQKPRSFDVPKDSGESTTQTAQQKRPKAMDVDDVTFTESVFDKQEASLTLEDTSPRGMPWGTLLFSAFGLILSLAIGLWIDGFIQQLFARHTWLGWLGVSLTTLFAIAALALIGREFFALLRLNRIASLRVQAQSAFETRDKKAAEDIERRIISLYVNRADMAAAKQKLLSHQEDIIDAQGRLTLIERELLSSLDERANGLVMSAAKRVAIVTAVSPRAIIDILYVLAENLRLIRAIAQLYNGRPGALGSWRLVRKTLTHLAVTGALSLGDGLIQQALGHGLASKISARFGEGVLNGMLTARIGLAAHDICRPIPFLGTKRRSLVTYLNALASLNGAKDTA